MPYAYLDDIATADVAFRAWGRTLEEMFAAAVDAAVNVMADDLCAIRSVEQRPLSLEHEQLDLLLFQFLQEVVFLKDAQQLLLRAHKVVIQKRDGKYLLRAELAGEKLNPMRHKLKVDIKAVTLHRLKVVPVPGGWEGIVVLDI